MAVQPTPARKSALQEAPERSRSGLSQLAWDLLAEQMLLTQLAGSIAMVTTGRPVVRVCRRCGTLASEAREMNEPLCPGERYATSHSYVDLDVRELAPVVEEIVCPDCHGNCQVYVRMGLVPMSAWETPWDDCEEQDCETCNGSGRVLREGAQIVELPAPEPELPITMEDFIASARGPVPSTKLRCSTEQPSLDDTIGRAA